MAQAGDRIEERFEDGDYIVVLEGPVLEVFHGPTASSHRRHVDHVAITYDTGRRGAIHMEISSKPFVGTDPQRDRIEVTDADRTRINALIDEAIARRGAG